MKKSILEAQMQFCLKIHHAEIQIVKALLLT